MPGARSKPATKPVTVVAPVAVNHGSPAQAAAKKGAKDPSVAAKGKSVAVAAKGGASGQAPVTATNSKGSKKSAPEAVATTSSGGSKKSSKVAPEAAKESSSGQPSAEKGEQVWARITPAPTLMDFQPPSTKLADSGVKKRRLARVRRKLEWLSWRTTPMGFQVVLSASQCASILFDVYSDWFLVFDHALHGKALDAVLTFLILLAANSGLYVLLLRGHMQKHRFAIPPLAGKDGVPMPQLYWKLLPFGIYEVLAVREILKVKRKLRPAARLLVGPNENAFVDLLHAWEAGTEAFPQLCLQLVLLLTSDADIRTFQVISLIVSFVMVGKTLLMFFVNMKLHGVGLLGERLSLSPSAEVAAKGVSNAKTSKHRRMGEGEVLYELETFCSVLRHVQLNPAITVVNLRGAFRHVRVTGINDAAQRVSEALSDALQGAGLVELDLGDNDLDPQILEGIGRALCDLAPMPNVRVPPDTKGKAAEDVDQFTPTRRLRRLFLDGSPRTPLSFGSSKALQYAIRAQLEVVTLDAVPIGDINKMRKLDRQRKPLNHVGLCRRKKCIDGCLRCPLLDLS